MNLEEIPMFVKEGTILPLAKPVEYVTAETVFDINCRVYGNANNKSAHLFEDNSFTYDYQHNQYNWVNLAWKNNKGAVSRDGGFKKSLYHITSWDQIN